MQREALLRSLGKYAKAYVLCVGIFSLLMVLVSLVPKNAIRPQVEESIPVLTEEGDRPAAWPTMHETPDALDSFTTSLSLNIAMHVAGNPLRGAVMCPYYRMPEQSMADALSEGLDKEAQIPYFRYWHGYLSVLVPLLTLFNIAQIRKVFLLAAMLLSVAVAALLGRKTHLGAALAWGAALLFSNIWIVTESTAQFFCYLAALVATIYVAVKSTEDKPLGEDVTGVFFFAVGASTVFLDFLDTPAVSLGLPLATYVVLRKRSVLEDPFAQTLGRLLILALSWAAGYTLLWATKWLIGIVVLGGVAAEDLRFVFGLRTSSQTTDGESVGRIEVIRRNVAQMFSGWMVACAKVLGVAWVAITCFFHKRAWYKLCIVLVAIAAIPVLWYLAMPNHAADHTFFTYRNLCISIYALGLMACFVTDWGALRSRIAQLLPARTRRD